MSTKSLRLSLIFIILIITLLAFLLTRMHLRKLAGGLQQDIPQNYSEIDSYRATLDSMWVSRLKICDLIDAGDYIVAESLIEQMKKDFGRSEDLVYHLLHFASIYEEQGQIDLARELYQDVSQNYSEINPYRATLASMWVSRLKICDLIDTGDYATAESLIEQMKKDFAGNKELADHLLHFAQRCEEQGQIDLARTLCQDVSQNYSKINSDRAALASMWVSRLKICDLIDAGDYAVAKSLIEQMKKDFAGNKELADHLLHFAWKCEEQGQRNLAKVLCQDVSQNYSEVNPDATAFANIEVSKLKICDLIDTGDYAAVKSSIKQMKKDFAGSEDLVVVVGEIGLEYYTKARLANLEGDIEREKELYRKAIEFWEQVIKEFPDSEMLPRAYTSVAVSYAVGLGEYQKGIDYFQKVIDNWPNFEYNWYDNYYLGECYWNLMNSGTIPESEAIPKMEEAYRTVVEKYPGCKFAPAAMSRLGEVNFEQGKFPEAVEYFEMSIEKDPQEICNIGLQFSKACTYIGNIEKASSIRSEIQKNCPPRLPP